MKFDLQFPSENSLKWNPTPFISVYKCIDDVTSCVCHAMTFTWVTPHLWDIIWPKRDEEQRPSIIANVSKNKLLIIYRLLLHPQRALLSQQTALWNKQNLCHWLPAVCGGWGRYGWPCEKDTFMAALKTIIKHFSYFLTRTTHGIFNRKFIVY